MGGNRGAEPPPERRGDVLAGGGATKCTLLSSFFNTFFELFENLLLFIAHFCAFSTWFVLSRGFKMYFSYTKIHTTRSNYLKKVENIKKSIFIISI